LVAGHLSRKSWWHLTAAFSKHSISFSVLGAGAGPAGGAAGPLAAAAGPLAAVAVAAGPDAAGGAG